MVNMMFAGRPSLLSTSLLLILLSLVPNCQPATVPTSSSTPPTTTMGNASNDSGVSKTTVKQQTTGTNSPSNSSTTTVPSTTTNVTLAVGTTKANTGTSGSGSQTPPTTTTVAASTNQTGAPTTTPATQTSGTNSSTASPPGSTDGTTAGPTNATQTPNGTPTPAATPSTGAPTTSTTQPASTQNQNQTAPTTPQPTTPVSTTLNTTIAGSTLTPTTNAPGTTNGTGTTTNAPGTTTNATGTTTNGTVVTNNPTTVTTLSTTQAVTTDETTTVNSSTPVVVTPNSTVAVTSTPTTTPVSTSNVSQTMSSSTTAPSTQPSTAKPSTVSPENKFVYISEIMVDKQGIFQTIEIQLSDQLDISHYAIVLVDGETSKTRSVIYLNTTVRGVGKSVITVQFNSTFILPSQGIGIAIYDTNLIEDGNRFTADWVVNTQGVVDALVIGKTYEGVSSSLIDVLTPGGNPFVLDPSKYGKEMTISRCSADFLRSTEMYALIHPSMGELNEDKCRDRQHYSHLLAMKIKTMDCGLLKMADNKVNRTLLHDVKKLVVKEVNKRCRCGFTIMHIIDTKIQCCAGTTIDMNFVAPNKAQDDEFSNSFKSFIQGTNTIPVQGVTYNLDQTCVKDCCKQVIQPISKDDNSHNIKVSVAVIVTLLVLFLIIVFVVYMYMRKKKYAVQQFRMSRLEEDEEDFDDMTVGYPSDDHDEFVGGQEATFDRRA